MRSVQVSAWAVREGDVSPGGVVITTVQRDPSRGRVVIGYGNGQQLTLSGERRVVVVAPRRPVAGVFARGARRARALLRRPR
jgi:hypothetical protein